ncbi:hypothetical protein D9Q98_004933 [Chlorella vulgaris]|uniref:C3H1-type domain-containing protein n=1 Tax=Chlorella vulgaris TaxID=3077 RepID=A0A9D4TNG9_CHLVU|nr:hypothetical protein D9Q98_004933 [Chlorella vulgaris]
MSPSPQDPTHATAPAAAAAEQFAAAAPPAPEPAVDPSPCSVPSDEFMMHAFKVVPCVREDQHAWLACPFRHSSEALCRRDPRLHTGVACPNMKQTGCCKMGEACSYAHNVLEYWLHPTRYRTQLCERGADCERNVCFFAHSADQLRAPDNSWPDGLSAHTGSEAALATPSAPAPARPPAAAAREAAHQDSTGRRAVLPGTPGLRSVPEHRGTAQAPGALGRPAANPSGAVAVTRLLALPAGQRHELQDPQLLAQVAALQGKLHPPSRRLTGSAAAKLFSAPEGLASVLAWEAGSSMSSASLSGSLSFDAPSTGRSRSGTLSN